MRIFRILWLLLLTVLGVFVVVSLVVVEGRLRIASKLLMNDMAYVRVLAKKPDYQYERKCRGENSLDVGINESKNEYNNFEGYRLRFVNQHDYLIEAVCRNTSNGPYEIKKGSLFLGVEKIGGSGVMMMVNKRGEIAEDIEASVVLKSYFRKIVVGYFWGELEVREWFDDEISYGIDAAATTCEGWGYRCCDLNSEVPQGVGLESKKVIDCPSGCDQFCKQKPMVLFLNTDPKMNLNERILDLNRAQQQVIFGYEVVDEDGEVIKVEIDFGDGSEVQKLENPTGTVDHTYYCGLSECRYFAQISAIDNEGNSLGQSSISMIEIRLRPI